MATLTERDYELLSTYLDGELAPAERSALEQRLQREPVLQSELESLRATLALLGMAERLPVPRNFTLDPAVVARPTRASFFDSFNLNRLMPLVAAGSMAAVALIVVAGVIFVNNRSQLAAMGDVALAPAQAPQADSAALPQPEAATEESIESFAVEEAAEADATEQAMENTKVPLEEPEDGMGGGAGGAGETGPAEGDESGADTAGGVGGGVGGGPPPGAYPPATQAAEALPDDSASRLATDEAADKMFSSDESQNQAMTQEAGAIETLEAAVRGEREAAARTLTLIVTLGVAGAVLAGISLAAVLIARRRR